MSLGDLEGREKTGEVVGTGGPKETQLAKPKKFSNKNSAIVTGFIVDIANKAEQLLPSNYGRNYILVQNNSLSAIRLAFGSKASALNGVKISAGGYYEPYIVPNSSISVYCLAANAEIVVVEGSGPI